MCDFIVLDTSDDFTFPIDIDSDQDDFIIETPNDDAENLTETLCSLKEGNVWITFWNERLDHFLERTILTLK
jgi:hypothetical protein